MDEHPQPVRELRRLYHLKLAYRAAFEAQSLAREGAGEPAAEKMAAALELAPEDDYLQALAGEVYFRLADRERAVAHFRQAVCLNPKARCYLTLFGNAELYDAEFRSAVERAAGPKASEEKSR